MKVEPTGKNEFQDVQDYPLFPSAMECIAKAFAHEKAYYPDIGIQCVTKRLEGMGDFLSSIRKNLPVTWIHNTLSATRYFELSPSTITQEDKIFKQANIVINRNSEEDPERMRLHVHDIIAVGQLVFIKAIANFSGMAPRCSRNQCLQGVQLQTRGHGFDQEGLDLDPL